MVGRQGLAVGIRKLHGHRHPRLTAVHIVCGALLLLLLKRLLDLCFGRHGDLLCTGYEAQESDQNHGNDKDYVEACTAHMSISLTYDKCMYCDVIIIQNMEIDDSSLRSKGIKNAAPECGRT